MKKNRLLSIFSILVFLASAAILTGCGAGSSATASAINAAGAGVGTVSSVTVTDSIETSGSLDADQLAKLTWKTSGIVDDVHVQVGQKVKALGMEEYTALAEHIGFQMRGTKPGRANILLQVYETLARPAGLQ